LPHTKTGTPSASDLSLEVLELDLKGKSLCSNQKGISAILRLVAQVAPLFGISSKAGSALSKLSENEFVFWKG